MRVFASRALRYTLRGLGALMTLVFLAVLVVVVVGGADVRRTHPADGHALTIPHDSAAIAAGERLAAIHGCTGCHEPDGGGGVFFETPLGDRVVSANLTSRMSEYGPRELERSIRHGIKPDGRSVAIMPSRMYEALSDADLAAILAYLRTLPPVRDTLPDTRLGVVARYLLLKGDVTLEADGIDHDAGHPAVRPTGELELGRYLAYTVCTECHGYELEGSSMGGMPPLQIAAAYSPEQFTRLMRTGVARDGSEKGLMTTVALGRFKHFTNREIGALYAFLQDRARR